MIANLVSDNGTVQSRVFFTSPLSHPHGDGDTMKRIKNLHHHHHHHIGFRARFPLPRVGLFDKSGAKTSR